MKVEQLSVFIENESGRLARVTGILGDAGINIRGLSLADMADFGILRLIVSDVEKAKAILADNGFTIGKTEVIAVEVLDRPGGIASILKALDRNGINVEYMYPSTLKNGDNIVMVFRFEELEKAIDALQKAGVRVLEREEVQKF